VVNGTTEGNPALLAPPRFRGPFNRVPAYREPGRININTIDPASGEPIWNALCGAVQTQPHPPFADVLRTGTVALPFPGSTPLVNGALTRPLRTMSGGVRRADFSEAGRVLISNAGFAQSRLTNPPVATETAGWWYVPPPGAAVPAGRSVPTIEDRFTNRSFTLLGDAAIAGTPPRRPPLFSPPPVESWATDGQRNEWFRLQTLVRANAQATVRSEVYAIWVTLGLFEVTDSPAHYWHSYTSDPTRGSSAVKKERGEPSPAYPDGKRLVREYGSQTGNVIRHRAFYIFDRSVPVEYTPGIDTNVSNGLLVERVIE
jgi:hypothetical protein